jgi:hypothetical protein
VDIFTGQAIFKKKIKRTPKDKLLFKIFDRLYGPIYKQVFAFKKPSGEGSNILQATVYMRAYNLSKIYITNLTYGKDHAFERKAKKNNKKQQTK